MSLHIYKNPDETSQALAAWITADIETALQKQDRYTFALTGGNSPKRLYELLAADPFRKRIDWEKLHIFWGDERAVPFDDERNNARMTYEHLLNKVPVNPEQVHPMPTDEEPEAAAAGYEQMLKEYFGETGPSFDLVLNGMGDDGHTLSLFPGTAAIYEGKAWVKAYYLEPQQMFRITLTPPIVNRAKKVVFLAFGNNKAPALYEVLEGERNPDKYPSQIIQPASGELYWFTDAAAAANLKKK